MAKFNPFNPNSVVTPTLFAGRTTLVNNVCKKLAQLKRGMASSFIIYGEKGIGKTALARLIRYIATINDKELHSLNLLSSYYSVESGQEIGSVLQEAINKLTDEMEPGMVDQIGSRLGSIFKNGKFQIGAFGLSLGYEQGAENQIKNEIAIKDQAVSILANIIKGIRDDDNKKDGILIIIDEIHNLKNITSAASILRNILTTLEVDNLGQISFLLVGYEEDMEKFFSGDSSSRRTFDPIKLDVMPDAEAVEVLKKGFGAAEVNYEEEPLNKDINMTGGYPHVIQILGYQLIEVDLDNKIAQDDWDNAIFEASMILQSKDFSTMYSFNKPQTVADQILVKLAEENQPMTRKEIGDSIRNKNVYQYIPQLKKLGALKENEDKKLFLQSQLLRTSILMDVFIRRRKKK